MYENGMNNFEHMEQGNLNGNGNGSGMNNNPYRPGVPSGEPPKPGKKGKMAKKVAGITAAAVLFGTVSGGVMTGVSLIGSRVTGLYAANNAQSAPAEPQAPAPALTTANNNSNQTAATPVSSVNDVSGIVENAMPSVVAINDTMTVQQRDFFGMPQTFEAKSSGSGIIVGENDKELLIVTNNHVVADSKELKVAFIDDEVVEAVVKGTDSDSDLAVIAVSLENIPEETQSKVRVAKLGDSDALKVGQGVIAIGNALGYGQSVTVGYVSALNREVRTSENNTRTLLQTDAAINPGNSGGALVNMKGEVVGINAAKYASTEVEGIGYAIPISKAEGIIGDLMNKKTQTQVAEEKRGYLGIQGIAVDSDTAKALGMPEGVYIYKILEDGAAAGSGLFEKDIITQFDGQSVKTMADLQEVLASYEVGETVNLTVQSLQDGQYVEHKVPVTLAPMPANEP